MNEQDVIRYLGEHQDFFEKNAYLLADMTVPHPHGGRTVSIGERQVAALRDKVKLLEAKLAELIQFGQENDAVSDKMHRLGLSLLGARSWDALLYAAYFNLREDFGVPHVALRIWGDVHMHRDAPEFAEEPEEVQAFAASLAHPYCGPLPRLPVTTWLGEAAPQIRSVALVPLRDGPLAPFGMLLLASEDIQRFYPEMGTLYLARLGEMVSTALARELRVA
ncbi:MAG: DUF484 family protein [Betaproteobacteria bacterium]|nr:DUF484 family protein [Betaproteobacteria bacterium]